MSGTDENRTRLVDERLTLGTGFGSADRRFVVEALASLAPHLASWPAEEADVTVSVKDRDRAEQKVTLEAKLPHLPALVASAHHSDLDRALVEARKELSRQIEDAKDRREPRKGRAHRPTA
jgi:ribosome-associated translation inhibitor RaiA